MSPDPGIPAPVAPAARAHAALSALPALAILATLAALAALAILAGVACARPVSEPLPGGVLPHSHVRVPHGIELDLRDESYLVHGATAAELRESIERNNPGRGGAGWSQWGLHWGWKYHQTGGGTCSLEDVTLRVEVAHVLPSWDPPEQADSALVADWNRFFNEVRAFHYGYRDVVVEQAREIHRRLERVAAPSCRMAGNEGNRVARNLYEQARERTEEYRRNPPENRRIRWFRDPPDPPDPPGAPPQ